MEFDRDLHGVICLFIITKAEDEPIGIDKLV